MSRALTEYAVTESTVLAEQETSFQHSQGLLSICTHFVAMVTPTVIKFAFRVSDGGRIGR